VINRSWDSRNIDLDVARESRYNDLRFVSSRHLSVERDFLTNPNRRPVAIYYIVTVIIFAFYAEGKKEQRERSDLENTNLTILHVELDPLVRKFLLQLVEARELIEVISRLKMQLLDVNG